MEFPFFVILMTSHLVELNVMSPPILEVSRGLPAVYGSLQHPLLFDIAGCHRQKAGGRGYFLRHHCNVKYLMIGNKRHPYI